MLFAQLVEDSFREHQKIKLRFSARCRFVSARTKRALENLKDRVHNTRRDYQTMMAPYHHYYMIIPPSPLPPQSWPNGVGDAAYYVPSMPFPPPPAPPFSPLHPSFNGLPPLHFALPYSICLYFNSSSCSHCVPKHQHSNRSCQDQSQGQDHSFTTDSTLFIPSSSSIFDDDEKAQIEEEENYVKENYHQRQEHIYSTYP